MEQVKKNLWVSRHNRMVCIGVCDRCADRGCLILQLGVILRTYLARPVYYSPLHVDSTLQF